ncbi:MAG: hypothetical protein SFZ23_12245 [Planctomycetota bacterium]|nr:hypothetical protein [Planctomycetota bacterium]
MRVVTGLFNSPAAATSAVRSLESRGVGADQISLMASDSTKKEDFGIETKTKVGEGAAIGAGLGGAVGALLAGLTTVGAIASGGIGLIAAGPLVAALAGAGAGAATGGVIGSLVGLNIPENEIKFFQDALQKGSVLVGVTCKDSDEQSLVRDAMKAAGAEKVANF